MSSISDRLIFLSKQYKSMRDFALSCNIEPNTMVSYVGGGNRKPGRINNEALLSIVEETGCNGHWLITGKEMIYLQPQIDYLKQIFDEEFDHYINNRLYIDYCYIPRLKLGIEAEDKMKSIQAKLPKGLSAEDIENKIEECFRNANGIYKHFKNKKAYGKVTDEMFYAGALVLELISREEDASEATVNMYISFINNRVGTSIWYVKHK